MITNHVKNNFDPRFGAIQASTRFFRNAVAYDITFDTPEDIGDMAAVLKTNDYLSRANPTRGPLSKEDLHVTLTAGNIDSLDSYVSVTYQGVGTRMSNPELMYMGDPWTCRKVFRQNPNILESLKKFAEKLPLSKGFQEFLVMAAHNTTVQEQDDLIKLPAGFRIFQTLKLEYLKALQDKDTSEINRLEAELAKVKVLMPSRAAEIKQLEDALSQPEK